jgi:hypothetical protein
MKTYQEIVDEAKTGLKFAQCFGGKPLREAEDWLDWVLKTNAERVELVGAAYENSVYPMHELKTMDLDTLRRLGRPAKYVGSFVLRWT